MVVFSIVMLVFRQTNPYDAKLQHLPTTSLNLVEEALGQVLQNIFCENAAVAWDKMNLLDRIPTKKTWISKKTLKKNTRTRKLEGKQHTIPRLYQLHTYYSPWNLNIAPENRPSQKETSISNHPFSGAMLVSGRVGFIHSLCIPFPVGHTSSSSWGPDRAGCCQTWFQWVLRLERNGIWVCLLRVSVWQPCGQNCMGFNRETCNSTCTSHNMAEYIQTPASQRLLE